MVTVMLSDWAKEEEKLVVFKSSDLRGCNSWYSGFPRVYQLRAVLPSGWEYRRALQPCELSEALKMPFLNLSANLNKQLVLNSAKTFPKRLSDELCVLQYIWGKGGGKRGWTKRERSDDPSHPTGQMTLQDALVVRSSSWRRLWYLRARLALSSPRGWAGWSLDVAH